MAKAIKEARTQEALDGILQGGNVVDMQDNEGGLYGVEQLCMLLEKDDYEVEWQFVQAKKSGEAFLKEGGDQDGAWDAWAVSTFDNVRSLSWRTGVEDTHIIVGITSNPEDDHRFENGYWVGLFPNDRALKKGTKTDEEQFATYKTPEVFDLRIEGGEVHLFVNGIPVLDSEVLGPTHNRAASLYAKVYLCEPDAMINLLDLRAVCQVSSINLAGNEMCDKGMERLAKALRLETSRVEMLDVSLNRITDDGINHLAEVLETDATRLAVLKLNYNEIGDAGAERLAQALSKDVIRFDWDKRYRKVIKKALEARGWEPDEVDVTDVDGDPCDIFNEEEEAEEEWFPLRFVRKEGRPRSNILRIELNDNDIGNPGARSLAEALELETCQVRELELTLNEIGDEGAVRLAEALEKEQCKIRILRMENNKIEKLGKKRLAQAISSQLRFDDV